MAIQSATILFTDVVGSTELSPRLAPDAVEEICHRRRRQVRSTERPSWSK
jgi:class 3 adenylate cyclase